MRIQSEDLGIDPIKEELREFLNTRGEAFKRVMPLAMRNLAIAQQRDKERYRLVRGGGWDRPKAAFQPGDYVMIRQVTKNTLQAPTRPHMLRIVEMKESGVVVLMEGRDAARCEKQVKNVAHCPLPILDTSMYPARYYRGPSVHCRVCGTRHRGTKMVLLDSGYPWGVRNIFNLNKVSLCRLVCGTRERERAS